MNARRLQFKSGVFAYYNTAWFLAAVTFCSYMLLPYVGYRAIGPIYLVSILAVASFGGSLGPTIFAASVSALVWDFFFIPPQFTVTISNFEDSMMVISFFVAALAGGFLTSTIRDQGESLTRREAQARELYELGRWLNDAKTEAELVEILRSKIESLLPDCDAVVLLQREGNLQLASGEKSAMGPEEWLAARNALTGRASGWSTPHNENAKCLCLPMRGNSGVLGVVALFPERFDEELDLESENYFATVIANVSVAIERMQFAETAADAKVLKASEQLHQTLLNSISHEMRTPLTVIMGSASLLMDKPAPPEFVSSVAAELSTASNRLNRVIENLLDMSRLNSGVLALKLEWHDVGDLVRASISKIGSGLRRHKIVLELAPALPPVKVDFRLLEHALTNLILNAALYSPEDTTIRVAGAVKDKWLTLSVTDCGPGIPEEARAQVFEKFYRVPGTKAGGTGLGLSIVKGIVEIHNGTVYVESDGTSGSKFVIRIPTENVPLTAEDRHVESH